MNSSSLLLLLYMDITFFIKGTGLCPPITLKRNSHYPCLYFILDKYTLFSVRFKYLSFPTFVKRLLLLCHFVPVSNLSLFSGSLQQGLKHIKNLWIFFRRQLWSFFLQPIGRAYLLPESTNE